MTPNFFSTSDKPSKSSWTSFITSIGHAFDAKSFASFNTADGIGSGLNQVKVPTDPSARPTMTSLSGSHSL